MTQCKDGASSHTGIAAHASPQLCFLKLYAGRFADETHRLHETSTGRQVSDVRFIGHCTWDLRDAKAWDVLRVFFPRGTEREREIAPRRYECETRDVRTHHLWQTAGKVGRVATHS